MVEPQELSEYEKIRAQNILEIQAAMKSTLGEIDCLKNGMTTSKSGEKASKRAKASKSTVSVHNRDLRPRKNIDYKEMIEPKRIIRVKECVAALDQNKANSIKASKLMFAF